MANRLYYRHITMPHARPLIHSFKLTTLTHAESLNSFKNKCPHSLTLNHTPNQITTSLLTSLETQIVELDQRSQQHGQQKVVNQLVHKSLAQQRYVQI